MLKKIVYSISGAALTPKSRIYQQAQYSLARNPKNTSKRRSRKANGVAAHRAGGLEKTLLLATNGECLKMCDIIIFIYFQDE